MKDYDKLPERLRGGVERYIEHGIPMGGFLTAVFANDLFDACARADATSITALPALVKWIYNEAPRACWGSRDIVHDWISDPESR